ncbi:hypothetical protein KQH90_05140 [Anaerosalibacter bizertensis]|uniref:hypothetical protein n=1 Tax=Anaerosalibacter bizertensis TaxID=932217 RepID=UPI001C0F3442|nr:hypothetical protein [Anaerosalibacter bizertensis]MBU5293426.1 hypothetical protein [Anaerosalibacter bizertensis]
MKRVSYILIVSILISIILVGCKNNNSNEEEIDKIYKIIENYFNSYYTIEDYKILDDSDKAYAKETDLIESVKQYTTEEFFNRLKEKRGSGATVDTAKLAKRNIKVGDIEYKIEKPKNIEELKDEITLYYTADFKFYNDDKEDILEKEGQIRLKKVSGEWKIDYEPGYIPHYMFEKIK